jgi:hypothetical protein
VEYARALLTNLERTLPQLKPLDRKYEAQAEIARDRQLLKRIQSILDEEDAKAQVNQEDEEDEEEDDDEWKELFSKPISQEKVVASMPPQTKAQPAPLRTTEPQWDEMDEGRPTSTPSLDTSGPSITLTEPTPTSATASSQLPTLRNRHTSSEMTSSSTTISTNEKPTATTTSSSNTINKKTQSKPTAEKELSTHRMEQEDLTSSLLSLASQLKSSSKTFQSTLEGEKSALDRAVSGIDRTSSTMEAAGKKMGLLRKMTEGKGWWGRMMLYAWIFGLWVVAILIVFVGPKLRF